MERSVCVNKPLGIVFWTQADLDTNIFCEYGEETVPR